MQVGRRNIAVAVSAPQVVANLVYFATEAEHNCGADVGVIQYTLQCALQLLGIPANRHTAAFSMWERHDTVNVRRQNFACKTPSDEFRSVRGAIAGCHHANIVASSHAPVGAAKAAEGTCLCDAWLRQDL